MDFSNFEKVGFPKCPRLNFDETLHAYCPGEMTIRMDFYRSDFTKGVSGQLLVERPISVNTYLKKSLFFHVRCVFTSFFFFSRIAQTLNLNSILIP